MALLVKHVFFKTFFNSNNKNDNVSKYMPPFWIFLYVFKTKDMLVIIHAKFEVNSCCGWDFRQGGGGNS